MSIEIKEKDYITCLGVDDKIHIFLPWENNTKCGVVVKNKKEETIQFHLKFSCYECTY